MRMVKTLSDEFSIDTADIDDITDSRTPFNTMNFVTEYPQVTAEQTGIMAFLQQNAFGQKASKR